MSDIDWSKAPEGFDYWIISTNNGATGEFYEHLVESGCFRDFVGVIYWTDKDIQNGLAELTIRPAKQEWNGEGPPPVGMVCRVDFPTHSYDKITINYMGDDLFVFVIGGDSKEYSGLIKYAIFSPSKTEEEKYDDALNNAARDYCGRIGIGEISVVAFKVGAQWQKEYKQP